MYADLYGSFIWAATESPKGSGNFTTTEIPLSCAQNSPIHCDSTPGSSRTDLGYIFSFGEDNGKDVFLSTSTGVYRVVDPSLCNYTCSKEKMRNVSSTSTFSSSYRNQMINWYRHFLPFLSVLFLLLVFTLKTVLDSYCNLPCGKVMLQQIRKSCFPSILFRVSSFWSSIYERGEWGVALSELGLMHAYLLYRMIIVSMLGVSNHHHA